MPLFVVTSSDPGAGKTGVAAAIARHFAYAGRPVECARAASADAAAADADAAFFAALDFAPGSPAGPLPASQMLVPAADRVLVCEAGPEAARAITGATVILVARGEVPAESPAGLSPAAVVVTAVHPAALRPMPATVEGAPIFAIPEDRTLAGFSVAELRALIHAEVLVEGIEDGDTCDYLVVAPIGSDAGQPYFRRFDSPAVIARFDKTDMHLAALRASPRCLVLTGGRYPSDYVYDAARASEVEVLLSPADTENTVIALEGIWDRTRFGGRRKLDRMSELLEATGFFEALGTAAEA